MPAPLPMAGKRLLLPYWADHNIGAGNSGAHIWWRETKDKELFQRANEAVQEKFCDPDFKTKRLLIITWQRVRSFYGNCDDTETRDVDVHKRDARGVSYVSDFFLQYVSQTNALI